MSLRRRLLLTIGGLVVSLLVVLELLGYFGARAFALSELEQEGELLARYQAERVRASLSYAEVTSEFLLQMVRLPEDGVDRHRVTSYLGELLNGNLTISSVEVYGLGDGPLAVRRTMEGRVLEAQPSFRLPRVEQWTLREQNLGRWVFPQSDQNATALHHVQRLQGVTVVIEVPVRLLAEPLEQAEGTVAYGFLATGAVVLFTNPTVPAQRRQERYDFITQILTERGKECDFFPIDDPIYGKAAWVGTAPVGDLDLTVGVVYLEGANFRPLYGLAWITLMVGLVGTGLLMVAVSWTSHSVARPLMELSATLQTAASQGFTQRVEVPRKASLEVERLTVSFNRMFDDLERYIGRLEDAAQERQAMESELAIAAEIQNSMLPKFPYHDRHCQAAGYSHPASKVGGDFLNIFPVGADRVGFFIGDVSGKGVPGAITMAFTASLLEHLGRAGLPPQECLAAANRALCAREEATSFVTAFFGVLEKDGTVRYANAGHFPPLLFAHGLEPCSPEIDSGLALGIYPEAVFGTGRFVLPVGTLLLLYTDGVTEAMDPARQEYGEGRLFDCLRAISAGTGVVEVGELLRRDVETFRDGVLPNDDLTVLLIKARGEERRV